MKENKYFIFLLSWFLPGSGHIIHKKYLKAIIFIIGILILLSLGLFMKGRFFDTKEMHPLLLLGFFSDVGNGIFYFIINALGIAKEEPNIASVTYHYGTTYLATAGLLNYLIALNAVDLIKRRDKE